MSEHEAWANWTALDKAREDQARLEVEIRERTMEGIYGRALAFADSLVDKIGHADLRELVIALHMQAGHDDWRVGTASFVSGEGRVKLVEDFGHALVDSLTKPAE